jgi:hypothetical protein
VGVFIWWGAFFFSWGPVPHWHSTLSVPAPEYFDGIQEVLDHNKGGHPSYLLGQTSSFGWWYYFPVAIAVKTPLAFLLLLGIGLVFCWKRRRTVQYLLPVAFVAGVLLPSMAGQINIGVRHVLPVYLGFSVIAAVGLLRLIELAPQAKWAAAVASVLMLWLVATGVIHHPDYLPYFNELVRNPEDVLLDSDYDWGQDNKRLAIRLHQLGATWVNYGYIDTPDHPTMGADHTFLQTFPGLPPIHGIHPVEPAEGWTAVCPTMDRTTQYGLEYRYPNLRPWFESLEPKERVGTLTLYYVPPGTLRRAAQ